MNPLPCLLYKKDDLKNDYSLLPTQRGDRKLIVTDLYETKEIPMKMPRWEAPQEDKKCSVFVCENFEMAIFNENAKQDRHYHKTGTEIYTVIEGNLDIEVSTIIYHLTEGDFLVVNPNSVHEVLSSQNHFLCQVITVNCGGPSDKYLVVPQS